MELNQHKNKRIPGVAEKWNSPDGRQWVAIKEET